MRIEQSTGRRVTSYEISAAHPDYSFGPQSDLSFLGYPTLEEVEPPTPGEGQELFAGSDEEYAPGKWRQTWEQRAIPAPESVTRLQARLALIDAGLWDAITAHFQDPSRTATELAFWGDAQTWRRDDATLIAAATALELTSEQIDELFKTAATL